MRSIYNICWPFLSHIINYNTIIPTSRNDLVIVMRIELCAKHSITVPFLFTLTLIFKFYYTFESLIIVQLWHHCRSSNYKEFSEVWVINCIIAHAINLWLLLLYHSSCFDIILFNPPSIRNCYNVMFSQPFLWFWLKSKVRNCIMLSSVLPFMHKSSWTEIIDS